MRRCWRAEGGRRVTAAFLPAALSFNVSSLLYLRIFDRHRLAEPPTPQLGLSVRLPPQTARESPKSLGVDVSVARYHGAARRHECVAIAKVQWSVVQPSAPSAGCVSGASALASFARRVRQKSRAVELGDLAVPSALCCAPSSTIGIAAAWSQTFRGSDDTGDCTKTDAIPRATQQCFTIEPQQTWTIFSGASSSASEPCPESGTLPHVSQSERTRVELRSDVC